MEFIQSIDWMQLLRCFVTGGGICIIGQILLDKTKLTPARILVIFVTVGAILGGLGLYKYLIDFAGARCNSSPYRIWSKPSKRSLRICKRSRFVRSVYRRSKSKRWRNSSSNILRIFSIFNCKTKNKKTIKISPNRDAPFWAKILILNT